MFRSANNQFRPTIRFWVNPPSVIIGRFQEVGLEVDVDLCNSHGIMIARRFTGGGTVYHDEGNLNFTILNRRRGETLDTIHKVNSAIIIASLQNMGLPSRFMPPNSINIDGGKISGAACALNSNYVLWHASILVSTNTILLNQTLSPSRVSTQSRFIRSKWQPVTILNAHLSKPVNVEDVTLQLIRSIQELHQIELQLGEVSETEEKTSRKLYAQKYATSQWNLNGNERNRWGTHTTIAV